MRVRQRRLLVLGLAGVAVQVRAVPGRLLRDGVDRRVHPRAVVAELLGRVVVPPPGGRVRRGDGLGTVGLASDGTAGIYFELRIDGQPVDPLQWLVQR